jgi:hypothetical protein
MHVAGWSTIRCATSVLDDEKRALLISRKLNEVRLADSQEPLNGRRGAIAAPSPDDFGWMAEQEAALMKVGILRDDGKALLRRILPHSGVGGLAKTDVSNVAASSGYSCRSALTRRYERF